MHFLGGSFGNVAPKNARNSRHAFLLSSLLGLVLCLACLLNPGQAAAQTPSP